jgi:radical SAM protein with 4Fe4S-binding SPASM domain
MNPCFIVLLDAELNWLGQPTRVFRSIDGRSCLDILLQQVDLLPYPAWVSVYGEPRNGSLRQLQEKYPEIRFLQSSTQTEVSRMTQVLDDSHCDTIIRVQADNPILGEEIIEPGLKMLQDCDFSYTWGWPVGINLEFISKEVLQSCHKKYPENRVRQTVLNELSLDTHTKSFLPQETTLNRPHVRWTTGDEDDYRRLAPLLINRQDFGSLEQLMQNWDELYKADPPAPRTLIVEPTNHCNLNCIMCPRDEMQRPFGTMKPDLYKIILKQAKECEIREIVLSGFGEPLLSKEIFNMIALAKDAGFQVIINTNGTCLTDSNIERLVAVAPDYLNVSLDGATKATYESVRIKGKFDNVTRNFEALLKARETAPLGSSMKISVKLIEMAATVGESQAFVDHWKDRVDQVLLPEAHNWGGVMNQLGSSEPKEEERFPCRELWRTMIVFYDGSVSICCSIFDNNFEMGHVPETHLLDIWRSSPYQKLRQCHLSGNYRDIEPCQDCDNWKSMG